MYSNYFEPIQHFFLLSCLREYVEFNCPLCSGPGRPWGHVAVPWRTTSYSAWGRGAGPRGSSPTPRGWQSPTPAGSSSQTQTTSVYRLDQQYLCTDGTCTVGVPGVQSVWRVPVPVGGERQDTWSATATHRHHSTPGTVLDTDKCHPLWLYALCCTEFSFLLKLESNPAEIRSCGQKI